MHVFYIYAYCKIYLRISKFHFDSLRRRLLRLVLLIFRYQISSFLLLMYIIFFLIILMIVILKYLISVSNLYQYARNSGLVIELPSRFSSDSVIHCTHLISYFHVYVISHCLKADHRYYFCFTVMCLSISISYHTCITSKTTRYNHVKIS